MNEGLNNNISEAITYIKSIEQQIMVTGSVDSEIDILEQIIKNLIANKISVEEAKTQAYNIISRRQDYH